MTADKLPPDLIPTPEQEALRSYINNPDPETKQSLLAMYEPMLQEAIAGSIEVINQFKRDQPAAFQYDHNQAFLKLTTKEITMEDYDKDPERQANYELYYSLDQYKLDDLLTYIQILKYPQKKPGKVLSDKLIKSVLAAMKRIHSGTNCPINFLAILSTVTSEKAITELYLIYQYEPYVSGRIKTAELHRQQTAYLRELTNSPKRIDHPTDGPDFKQSYQNFDVISEKLGDSLNELQAIIDQTGISDLVAGFIQKLQPGERIRPEKPSPFNLPNTTATMITNRVIHNPGRVDDVNHRITERKNPMTGRRSYNYKSKTDDLTWIINGELKPITNGPKLFNFFLQKANEQHWPEDGIKFNLQELVDIGIYSDKPAAYKGLENSVKKMQDIDISGEVTGYEGRKPKKIRSIGGAIIMTRDISFNQCLIMLQPIFNAGYIPITPITDPNFNRLPKLAYKLYDYIMKCARLSANTKRIKKDGYFNLSMEAIRIDLGLPSIEEAGKDPKYLIVDKIDKALGEIMDSAGLEGMKIEIITKYDENKPRPPVTDYLSGYIKITVDDTARGILEERAAEKDQEIKKSAAIKAKAIEKAAEKAAKSAK